MFVHFCIACGYICCVVCISWKTDMPKIKVESFDGENFRLIWQFAMNLPSFYPQIACSI